MESFTSAQRRQLGVFVAHLNSIVKAKRATSAPTSRRLLRSKYWPLTEDNFLSAAHDLQIFTDVLNIIKPGFVNEHYLGVGNACQIDSICSLLASFKRNVCIASREDMTGGDLVLEFVWQLIKLDFEDDMTLARYPDLEVVLKADPTLPPPTNNQPLYGGLRSSRDEEDCSDRLLLAWANHHLVEHSACTTLKEFKSQWLSNANSSSDTTTADGIDDTVIRATNFSSDWKDGNLFLLLLNAVAPNDCNLKGLELTDLAEKARAVQANAAKLKLDPFTSVDNILSGDDKTNFIFLLQLFRNYPNLGSTAVLITQCIQNDFCGFEQGRSPFVCPLHIGVKEAKRFLGEPQSDGPVAQIMRWARKQSPDALEIIHIRDWHNLEDPQQAGHLKKFGPHCIQNTKGSDFVEGIGPISGMNANERVLNATGLNDLEETDLAGIFKELRVKAKGRILRVGVIGVWTDAKVSFLLYDLKTRLGIQHLSTCSSLTSSFSRGQHFSALNRFKTMLDINVSDSVREFSDWLIPPTRAEVSPPPSTAPASAAGRSLRVSFGVASSSKSPFNTAIEGASDLSSEDQVIMGALFRNSVRVVIDQRISGGMSGAAVYMVKGFDEEGHLQGPFVVKLGPRKATVQERTNFERIEEILGNSAPAILESYESDIRGGIKFAFASHGGSSRTFKAVYRDPKTPQKLINKVLHHLFHQVLGRFYVASKPARFDIADKYNFDGKGWAWAAGGSDTPDAVCKRIQDLLEIPEAKAKEEWLEFPDGGKYRNVYRFLRDDLERLQAWSKVQSLPISYVHGDLNNSNILLDKNKNLWVIDFFFTEKFHVFKDVSKTENDVQYFETDLSNDSDLQQALFITRTLHGTRTDVVLPTEMPQLTSPTISRAFETVRNIRKRTAWINKVAGDNGPLPLWVTLLRYALHTMCFNTINRNQKLWALAAACSHAQAIYDHGFPEGRDGVA